MHQAYLKKSSVRIAASAALLLAINSGAVWSKKPSPTPIDEDLTGCLNTKNGNLRHLGEGDEPLKKCNKVEATVTLDVVGPNGLEPFSFALNAEETAVIVASDANGSPTSFSVECVTDPSFAVMLTAQGDIINGATSPIDLVGTAESDLPVLLDSDDIVFGLHGVRAFSNEQIADCIVMGVVQHSVLEQGEPAP